MHFRIRYVTFMFLFVSCVACSESHSAVPAADSGSPYIMGDAAPLPGHDSGSYEWPDTGSVTPTDDSGMDASVPALPVVRVVFDGPPSGNINRGSQDVNMFRFSLTASVDVEIRFLDFILEGVTSADRTTGSLGTELFRDLKVKDLDTGATIMGPISPSSHPHFDDSFIVHAGETRHFAITMDVSNHEDVPGEFFDGTHSYRVTVGDPYSGSFFEPSAVRIVATGEFAGPDRIENDIHIPGNVLTVVESELLVDLAASPRSSIAVKKQMNIPSAGFVFTASPASDVLLRSVRFTGMGDTGGGFARSALQHVITACAVFDGDIQLGLAQVPDTSGTMNITSINRLIPAGSSVVLVMRCTADSVVDVSDGDQFALGIASAGDIVAFDAADDSVSPTVSYAASANIGPTPYVIITVLDHGTLTVRSDNLRQSTILVAGGDVWQNFAQYRATAQYESMDIDEVRITSRGDASSFTQVAVAADGAILGWCILPAGTDQSCNARLDYPLHIERDSSRIFQVWGKLSNVLSSTAVAPGTPRCTGYPCSGAVVHLGIEAGNIAGEWDANYASSLNIRTTGAVSGDRLYAAGPSIIGNQFVIRRSKPTLTRQSLSTTTLGAGLDQDLYRFQVSADASGSIAIQRIGYVISIGRSPSSTFVLSNFGIRRGSSEMTSRDAPITDSAGHDLRVGSLASADDIISVGFHYEETITGSGNVYTLHAHVTGTVLAGDTVSTSLARNYAPEALNPVTGWTGIPADSAPFNGGSLYGPNLDLGGPAGYRLLAAGFLWSDMSEIPHDPNPYFVGGSGDWTNELYVEDLTQVTVISR